jgi:hypothetical protein
MDINKFAKPWLPYVWLKETTGLTLEERGVLVDLVSMAMVSPVEGSICGALRDLAGALRVREEHALRHLQTLQGRKFIDVFPDILKGGEPGNAWMKITVRQF